MLTGRGKKAGDIVGTSLGKNSNARSEKIFQVGVGRLLDNGESVEGRAYFGKPTVTVLRYSGPQ